MSEQQGGKSLVDIKAELQRQKDLISSQIGAPGGDFIKVQQDKKFKTPDGEVSDGPLSVVILAFASANLFYDRPYKEGEILPPACFALGTEPRKLVPSDTSPDKQSDNCEDCPNNVFGSDGNGKACTNTRILAVTTPDSDPKSPVWNLKVSPTAIRAFDAYVKTIKEQFDTVPIGVVTDIYFDPGLKYPSLRFGNPRVNENLEVHFPKQKAALERLLAPIDVSKYTPPAPAKGGKGKK